MAINCYCSPLRIFSPSPDIWKVVVVLALHHLLAKAGVVQQAQRILDIVDVTWCVQPQVLSVTALRQYLQELAWF